MDLKRIADQPAGARFYRCAFQVKTFDYVVRHSKPPGHRVTRCRRTMRGLIVAGGRASRRGKRRLVLRRRVTTN